MKAVPPYRCPDEGSVRPGPWTLRTGDVRNALPDVIATWDYQATLHLERRIEVDIEKVLEQTGLGEHAPLALGVLWTANPSALRGAPARVPLRGRSGDVEVVVTASLDGRLLGGTLEIETALFLERALEKSPRPRAWRAGSVLWRDTAKCRLQGDAPLFPIAVVDFSALGHDPRAPWFVEVGNDLDALALSSVQLLVNTRAEEVVEALENAADPSDHHAAVLSAMYYDTGRTLLESALSREDLQPGRDFEEETLGDVLSGLLVQLFPRYDLTALRRLRGQDPPRWASEVAAALALFSKRQAQTAPPELNP